MKQKLMKLVVASFLFGACQSVPTHPSKKSDSRPHTGLMQKPILVSVVAPVAPADSNRRSEIVEIPFRWQFTIIPPPKCQTLFAWVNREMHREVICFERDYNSLGDFVRSLEFASTTGEPVFVTVKLWPPGYFKQLEAEKKARHQLVQNSKAPP